MRVLFLTVQYLPETGGIASLLPVLAKEMKRLGHEVVIVTPKSHMMQPGFEIIENVRIYRFLEFPHSLIKKIIAWPLGVFIIFRLAYIIKKEKIDVVNAHFVYREAIYALILKKIMRFPLVVSVHGYDVQVRPRESKFYGRWTPKVLRASDFVTACSESLLNDACHLEPSIKGKSTRIYNCIDADEFEKPAPFRHGRRYIFSVGNFVPKKGFDVLIKAFANVRNIVEDIDLIMAGDGPERDKCEVLADALSLRGRVVFYGKSSKEETIGLFKGCEFFVLSSRQEPFGIVNLEAMAAGKAILATNVDGVPEVVTNGVNGILVKADDESALAQGIRALWQDAPLRQRLGSAGRLILSDKFRVKNTALEYIESYEKAVVSERDR